jgi:hypothetical protein
LCDPGPDLPKIVLRPFEVTTDKRTHFLSESIRQQGDSQSRKSQQHDQCLELERVGFSSSRHHLSKHTDDEKIRPSQHKRQ